jgi:dihydroorotate dehydrogenase electron transfer subunit
MLETYHAPAIAAGARAGQVVHLATVDDAGLKTRWPQPIHTADPASGSLTLLVDEGQAGGPASRPRPGDAVEVHGPYGRPFEVDPRSRHLLLIAGGRGIAGIRMLADEAVRDGRQVVLLFGAPTAVDVYPSSLLPDEVEYVVTTTDGSLGHRGEVAQLVPGYEAWADQAFAAGPAPMVGELARLAAGRRGRLGVAALGRKRGRGRIDPSGSPAARRKAFLQVAIEQVFACEAGTCYGCVVLGADGAPLRVCREGPVFAADELAL